MRTVILTAFLALSPMVCVTTWGKPTPANQQQDPKPPQTTDQEQRKPAQQPPATAPVSISPMIPLAPAATGEAAGGEAGAKPALGAPVNARTYIIGAEDILGVTVFENPGFAVPQEVVRPDGKITMPLLGEITAANKTPEELAEEIQKVLVDRYMKEPPHVQVVVIEVRSKNYYLQGEVNKPGKYTLVVPTTIMQALVNAGGFRDFANKKDIKIQRGDKFFRFNYTDVSKGKHLEQNILLQPDDQIYVR